MSMHEIEAFVELAVRVLAQSDLPLQHKRDLIYTLYNMESRCDCGFTNLRNLDDLINCSYTFLFERTAMYDYADKRDFYDNFEDKYAFDFGDVYMLLAGELSAFEHYDAAWAGKICVDSGSEAWEGMVKAGAITGAGAEPVTLLDTLTVLTEIRELMETAFDGDPDEYILNGMLMLFFVLGLDEEASDAQFEAVCRMSRQEMEALYEF